MSIPGSVEITLPAIAEFSGSHQLDDKMGLHYSVMWTGWSSFDKLEAEVRCPRVQHLLKKKISQTQCAMQLAVITS